MTIEILKSTNGGSDNSRGIYHDIKEVKKEFENFLKCHGTRFDDYDSFHCRFVNEKTNNKDKER